MAQFSLNVLQYPSVLSESDSTAAAMMREEGAAAATPTVMFRQERDLHYASLVADEDTNVITLSDASVSLQRLQVDLTHVLGCQHDVNECNFCAAVMRSAEAEAEDEGESRTSLERLAGALSHYVINDRSLARDALTWLSAYEDWTSAYTHTLYFRNNYRELDEAMLAINRLADWQVDGRAALYYSRAMEDGDAVEALTYCSWPYIPRPGTSEVFYVRTRAPPHEETVKYLNTIFDIPAEMIKVITLALAPPNKPRSMVLGQIKRRISDRIKSSPPGSPRLGLIPLEASDDDDLLGFGDDISEPYDAGADPRPARALRLDKVGGQVREQFDKTLPHLVLVSEDGLIRDLAMRPDYALRRHERYVNVFFLTLPKDAPAVWVDKTEAW